jgi:hypothetical protein
MENIQKILLFLVLIMLMASLRNLSKRIRIRVWIRIWGRIRVRVGIYRIGIQTVVSGIWIYGKRIYTGIICRRTVDRIHCRDCIYTRHNDN